MKVIHMQTPEKQRSKRLSYSEHISLATELEQCNEVDEAIEVYRQCTTLKPADEYAYDRLMYLYHCQKNYEKELEVINEGIKTFEHLYEDKLSKSAVDKTIQFMGGFILKSTGFSQQLFTTHYKPQPILKWQKRALLIKRRIS